MRQGLWRTTLPLRDAGFPVKWVAPEGIHLTMKFLGDVADEREPELIAALGRAVGPAAGGEPRELAIAIAGFGAFPDLKRPRVVWAGVAAEPVLELLQDGVERAFAPLGFPTEARAFRPHITLGRAARDARPRAFDGLAAALEGLAFAETASVATVDLMQSTLERGGAVYQVRHRERLS